MSVGFVGVQVATHLKIRLEFVILFDKYYKIFAGHAEHKMFEFSVQECRYIWKICEINNDIMRGSCSYKNRESELEYYNQFPVVKDFDFDVFIIMYIKNAYDKKGKTLIMPA